MLDREACILAERYVQLRELSIFSQEAFFIAIISFISFLKKRGKSFRDVTPEDILDFDAYICKRKISLLTLEEAV